MSWKTFTLSLLWVSLWSWHVQVAHGQVVCSVPEAIVQGLCGGTLMKAFGYVASPNYPNAYTHDSDCSWIISAARGHKITFKVTDFLLEPDRQCQKDWLEIYDGPNFHSPLVGRYCGANRPFPVTSSSNKLYIRFKTNSAKEFKGFKAVFNSSLVCGGTYLASSGSLSSPNSPNNYYGSSDCVYRIDVPIGKIVEIRFTQFNVEAAGNGGVCYDYIEVHDGKTVLAPSLGKFCGTLTPFSVRSTSNIIIIRFISDKSINNKGFRLTYSAAVLGGTTTPPPPPPLTTPSKPAVCLSTQFRCANGKCVDLRWRCDRQDDCGDLSDEAGCPCRRYQFKCANGKCSDRRWRCDGYDDCGDGSDERNCTKPTTATVTVSCSQSNGGCDHTCIHSIVRGVSAIRCTCRAGYQLQPDGKTCIDINECREAKRCHQMCLNIPGKFVCACKRGYYLTVDKVTCRDIDECHMKNNGDCKHICINNNGSYRCACRPGFHLQPDGKTCYDIDECSFSNAGCNHTCVNTIGGFQCQCPSGYKLGLNNKTCEDINECSRNNGGCEQVCMNEAGSHRCECRDGYMVDPMTPTMCMDIDECMEGIPACFNCINLLGSYQCDCDPGFVPNANKKQCLDVDECLTNNGGCGQHVCVNSFGTFRCECLTGYVLDPKTNKCKDINECAVNGGTGDCEQLCINTVGSYKCGCRDGFKLRNEKRCLDIDECAIPKLNKCQHFCNNTVGSFSCSCKKHYHKSIDGYSCTKKKVAPGCGVALKAHEPKRRGWQDAAPGSWPWSVLLHFDSFGDIGGCMGTLIDKQWVLVTSHCVHLGPYIVHKQFIKVELGAHFRSETRPKPKLLNVAKVVVHSNFKPDLSRLSSNIALLQLSKPVNFTENVLPICLPTRHEINNFAVRGSKGVIIGWGKRANHKIHGNLRQNRVTLTRRQRCSWAQRWYDNNRLICAGYSTSHATCISDSGSPLMFTVAHEQNPQLKRWVLGGMLSWGLNTFPKSCHKDYGYTAYVHMGKYLKWLTSNMKGHKGS